MLKKILVFTICMGLIFPVNVVHSVPKGGKVAAGQAKISHSGKTATINQTSERAIINWHSFDIGKNEAVRHNMPSSGSAGLHRVVGGGGPSQIEGLLQSNGNIYLVNPAGVVIHNGAKIDVNGFVATSRDIANDNFMKSKMIFDRPGLPNAAIHNMGEITLKDNGLAALVAPAARNDGVIAGKLAKVALAAGDEAWKLDMAGDDLVAFTLDEKLVNTLHDAGGKPLAQAQNNGKIKTDGGVVVMTAAQLDGFVGSVVNNGEVSASSMESKGGKIIFRGQGSNVDVVNKGILDASSRAGNGGSIRLSGDANTIHAGKIDVSGKKNGGNAVLTGGKVTLASQSKIIASGNTGGGTVLAGGNARGKGPEKNASITTMEKGAEINVDALDKGDGGQVVLWADKKATVDGIITARGGENAGNGGKVETSGKKLLIGDSTVVDTSAPKGDHGQWLLDPENFVIAAEGGDISGKTISANLELGDVQIDSYNGKEEGFIDIIINDSINWSSDTILSLNTEHNIILNGNITASGNYAGLYLFYGRKDGNNLLLKQGKINLTGRWPSLHINSTVYDVINNINDLQNIEDLDDRSYALGADIDASDTLNWNGGKGFNPIGETFEEIHFSFGGQLNGLGHTISNLYINRPDDELVGLFARTSTGSSLKNIYFQNVNITGGYITGALVAESSSNINNVIVSGVIKSTYADTSDNPSKVSMAGGIVGRHDAPGAYNAKAVITNCVSKASVTGYMAGGIAAINHGTIEKSYNEGAVTGLSSFFGETGGIVGFNDSYITESYNAGNITGVRDVGGIAGFNNGKIDNSYSTGHVAGTINVGGLIGSNSQYNGSCAYTYSTGNVEGNENVGGLIGKISDGNDPYKINNSYWNNETSNQTASAGGTGKTTAEMLQQDTYENWDFERIWKIQENVSFPQLVAVANAEKQNTYPVKPEPDNPVPDNPNPDNPKPDNPNPDQPGTSNPEPSKPEPVVPAPSEPEKPSQTLPGNANSSNNRPEQTKPTPVKPDLSFPNISNKPATPGNIGYINQNRPSIKYTKINDELHVFQDTFKQGTLAGTSNNYNLISENKYNSLSENVYDPYTATPEERKAYKERIEREHNEKQIRFQQDLEANFRFNRRENISELLNKYEQQLSSEIESMSKIIETVYAGELSIIGSIFMGGKISGTVSGMSNMAASVISNVKSLFGAISGNGWGDQLRKKPYIQALVTKDYMALYMLTVAKNAEARFFQTDNISDKLQLLCQMEMALKIAEVIMNDYNDTIRYFAIESGQEAAKELVKILVDKTVLSDSTLNRYFSENKSYAGAEDLADALQEDVDLTKQIGKGVLKEINKGSPLTSENINNTDDSIEGMVNRLMYSDNVNYVITDTLNKYNNMIIDLGLQNNYPDGKIQFNQDIRDCWYWDPEIAISLNNILTSNSKMDFSEALIDVLGPALNLVIGIKPKKEQLDNLYSTNS